MREIVFVCFTTYQLLIAMYYAYNLKGIKKTLIFRNFANYNIPTSYYNKYFDNIFNIPYYENANIFTKQYYKSYYAGYLFKFSDIYEYIAHVKKSIVIFFSDQEVMSNRIIRILKNDASNTIILSEEGLGIYESVKSKFSIKTKIGNLLCGLRTCELIGGCNFHDVLLARKPEAVHERLCNNGRIIKQNDLFIDSGFIDSIVIDDDRIKKSNKKRLIILGEPISEYNIKYGEYLEFINRIIEDHSKDYDIFIKPHPRENSEIYKRINNCIVFDDIKWLPVELLVLKFHFDILINTYSASVVNIAKTNPNLVIFLIYKLFNMKLSTELTETFNKYPNIIDIDDYSDIFTTKNNNLYDVYNKNDNYDLDYLNSLIYKYDK